MYDQLLSPIQIRGLELRNRVVYPAMGTKMAVDKEVTDQLIAYHLARVKGGCGLNILEVASATSRRPRTVSSRWPKTASCRC